MFGGITHRRTSLSTPLNVYWVIQAQPGPCAAENTLVSCHYCCDHYCVFCSFSLLYVCMYMCIQPSTTESSKEPSICQFHENMYTLSDCKLTVSHLVCKIPESETICFLKLLEASPAYTSPKNCFPEHLNFL